MNKIEFSIIIPLYNREKYIKKCMESALNQSFDGNFEVLVINDGSTDNSIKILDNFKDEKLRIFNNKNFGPAYSRNFGIEKSCGKYIIFLDSDDLLDKNALQNFKTALCSKKEDEADIIFAPYCAIREHKNDIKTYFPLKKFIEKKDFLNIENTNGEILKGNFEPWAKAYKKNFLTENEIKFTEARLAEDLPFFYKAVIKAEKILLCSEPAYFYRRGHKEYIKQGKYNWVDEVIKALNASDEIFYSYKNFKIYEKIYAKNCLNICLFWSRKFKKLENRQEFYKFSQKYLDKYGLALSFYMRLFINNLIDI